MLTVTWNGGMAFEAEPPSGAHFTMDASPDSGGRGLGPSPVEALLASAAACSAMDVVAILSKMRQHVSKYRVEVEWTRVPEGQFPRPILSMIIRHVLSGEGLEPEAVRKAVELSDEKYCTVIATLRTAPCVSSEYKIES